MTDVYVYDTSLNLIGMVDSYRSVIWANRYQATGDCELYVPATTEMLNLLRMNYYLSVDGSEMVCRIKQIELDTSTEEGNYLIVHGYDVKGYLDQRVVWSVTSADGNAESFVRQLVSDGMITSSAERKLLKGDGTQLLYLDTAQGFTEATTEQVSYKNIGEKVREICVKFGFGYKVVLRDGSLYFGLYKGENRANSVVFSNDYENLSETSYVEDETKMGNVALVAGEGQGTARAKEVAGSVSGTDRYEIFVDAKDISKTVTYQNLTEAFPSGTIQASGDIYEYVMASVDILIIDASQLATLQSEYPSGTIVTVNGVEYYRITNVAIAQVPSASPANTDNVTLYDVIYTGYLLARGYEKLAAYGVRTSFEGVIAPNVTWEYNKDYFLGDIVTVENDYGISVAARITEVVEVNDDNGYNVEPKFEYITEE